MALSLGTCIYDEWVIPKIRQKKQNQQISVCHKGAELKEGPILPTLFVHALFPFKSWHGWHSMAERESGRGIRRIIKLRQVSSRKRKRNTSARDVASLSEPLQERGGM